MKPVSAAYRAAIQAHKTGGVRSAVQAEVYFGVVDEGARAAARLTLPPALPFAPGQHLLQEDAPAPASVAAFAPNFFALNGSQLLGGQAAFAQNAGYISAVAAGANGNFAAPPVVQVAFGAPRSMAGLMLHFDPSANGAPTRFLIEALAADGALLLRHPVTGHTGGVYREVLSIQGAAALRLTFLAAAPFGRVRLWGVTFGVGYTYGGGQLLALTHTRTAHPLGLELPRGAVRFTLANPAGRFDIHSEESLVPFLRQGQPVRLRYGLALPGGEAEWFLAGHFFLKSWDTTGANATFVAEDVLGRLCEGNYQKGAVAPAAKSMAQLAAEVLQDAGVQHYEVGDYYAANSAKTRLPLPEASHAACLQMAANCALCSLFVAADGRVVMRGRALPAPGAWRAHPYPAALPLLPYGTGAGVFSGSAAQYATFERDFFALDGGLRLAGPGAPFEEAGFVADVLPGADGRYLAPAGGYAGLGVDFGHNVSFGTLTVRFSQYSGTSEVYVWGYRAGSTAPVYAKRFAVTGPVCTLHDAFEDLVWVYLLPTRNTKPHRMRILGVKASAFCGLHLTGADVLNAPKKELLPAVATVQVPCTDTRFYTHAPGEVMRVTLPTGALVAVNHPGPLYALGAAVLTPGARFATLRQYAHCSFIQLAGAPAEAEVAITGHGLWQGATHTLAARANAAGETVTLENPLLMYQTPAANLAQWAAAHYARRAQYQITTLGHPEIDAGDEVTYEGRSATVTENIIEISEGGMRGRMLLRGEV